MKVYTLRPGLLYQRGKFDRYALGIKIEELRKLHVKIIVNMTARTDPQMETWFSYVSCPIPDSHLANFEAVEDALSQILPDVKRGDAVLVHCNGGRNRSSLFSARLLMELEGLTGKQAVKELRRLRPNALSNPHFVKYLEGL